jgi:hypothetical protein
MDYREMTRLAADPVAVRSLAHMLLSTRAELLSETAEKLLASLSRYQGEKPLSTRQLEALYSIRESTSRRTKAGKYDAATLVRQAWEARFDLNSEDDELWLEAQSARQKPLALTHAEWRKLLAICRQPEIDLIGADYIELT